MNRHEESYTDNNVSDETLRFM